MIGTLDTILSRLAELEEIVVQEVVRNFPDVLDLEPLRFFAREFMAS